MWREMKDNYQLHYVLIWHDAHPFTQDSPEVSPKLVVSCQMFQCPIDGVLPKNVFARTYSPLSTKEVYKLNYVFIHIDIY